MYYLSCVDIIIQYDNEDNRLTNYKNYDLLTIEEIALLFSLITIYNPKMFIDAGVFFVVDPNLVPPDMSSEFYKIEDERINFNFNDEIMIRGKTCKIVRIWLVLILGYLEIILIL